MLPPRRPLVRSARGAAGWGCAAAGLPLPLRDPSPYAIPLPTRPLSPSPPLMHQHAASSHGMNARLTTCTAAAAARAVHSSQPPGQCMWRTAAAAVHQAHAWCMATGASIAQLAAARCVMGTARFLDKSCENVRIPPQASGARAARAAPGCVLSCGRRPRARTHGRAVARLCSLRL